MKKTLLCVLGMVGTFAIASAQENTVENTLQLQESCGHIPISYWSGLKVYGHTDNVGSSAYNQKLSESRALSVKKYMFSNGIITSNVIAIGMGENKPIDTNDTPQGRQNNRRVEFEITK